MASSPVQRFYKYHAIFYDFTRWMILHGRAQAVERMQLQPDSRVLEVGCGTGLNFAHVAKRLGAEGELVGLDFSADMLKRAERRVAARGWQNIELTQGDATQMQLGRQFDAIFFAYSLTMIPDWRAALDRAWEHLAPGGRIVVLDFSAFHGWGPLAPVMRAWLRANHVETQQPYGEELAKRCDRSEVTTWLGGYNFTAIGWKDR